MRIAIFAACVLLGGCVYSLGNVQPQTGRNADQQQLDTLTCQDRARLSIQTAGRETGDFLLGFTLVGAPVALELDKKKQRSVFAECMQSRGYTILPAA